MRKIEDSVVVDAPVRDVFAYATTWEAWTDWFVGFKDCSLVAGTEHGDGAVYDYTMWVLGLPFRCRTEIHDLVENVGWRGRGIGGVPHRTRWIFEDLDGRTRMTYIAEYALPVPLLGPLFCALLADPAWRRLLRRSLENFAAHFRT